MFEGYRDGHLALGLALGISLTLNAFAWLYIARPERDSYAEQQCARQQTEHAASSAPFLNLNQPPRADIDRQQAGKAENHDPDWCDLAAQQSMARSTVGMEQAAWVTALLTFAGVLLLGRTLIYTREAANHAGAAVDESRNATAAANDTVTATREIGNRQVRAYLLLANVRFSMENDRYPSVHARVKNFGQSPAHNVRMWGDISVGPSFMPKGTKLKRQVDDSPSLSVIGPGFHAFIGKSSVVEIDDIGLDRIRDGVEAIFFYGGMEYEDVFGVPHSTSFLFYSTGLQFADGPYMGPYAHGNHAD